MYTWLYVYNHETWVKTANIWEQGFLWPEYISRRCARQQTAVDSPKASQPVCCCFVPSTAHVFALRRLSSSLVWWHCLNCVVWTVLCENDNGDVSFRCFAAVCPEETWPSRRLRGWESAEKVSRVLLLVLIWANCVVWIICLCVYVCELTPVCSAPWCIIEKVTFLLFGLCHSCWALVSVNCLSNCHCKLLLWLFFISLMSWTWNFSISRFIYMVHFLNLNICVKHCFRLFCVSRSNRILLSSNVY